MQLARILEKSWVRLSSSRLSLPFLRPLLPLTTSSIDASLSSYDLIRIIEKIRSLEYSSATTYLDDINNVRNLIIQKVCESTELLYNDDTNTFHPNRQSISQSNGTESSHQSYIDRDKTSIRTAKVIVSSFDTIFEACKAYLMRDRALLIDSYAKKIKDNQLSLIQKNSQSGNGSCSSSTSQTNASNSGSLDAISTNVNSFMSSLWRKECSRSIVSAIKHCQTLNHSMQSGTSSTIETSDESKYFSILERDIDEWKRYLEEGMMPENCRGRIDPWGIWNPSNSLNGSAVNGNNIVADNVDEPVHYFSYKTGDLNTFFNLVKDEVRWSHGYRLINHLEDFIC